MNKLALLLCAGLGALPTACAASDSGTIAYSPTPFRGFSVTIRVAELAPDGSIVGAPIPLALNPDAQPAILGPSLLDDGSWVPYVESLTGIEGETGRRLAREAARQRLYVGLSDRCRNPGDAPATLPAGASWRGPRLAAWSTAAGAGAEQMLRSRYCTAARRPRSFCIFGEPAAQLLPTNHTYPADAQAAAVEVQPTGAAADHVMGSMFHDCREGPELLLGTADTRSAGTLGFGTEPLDSGGVGERTAPIRWQLLYVTNGTDVAPIRNDIRIRESNWTPFALRAAANAQDFHAWGWRPTVTDGLSASEAARVPAVPAGQTACLVYGDYSRTRVLHPGERCVSWVAFTATSDGARFDRFDMQVESVQSDGRTHLVSSQINFEGRGDAGHGDLWVNGVNTNVNPAYPRVCLRPGDRRDCAWTATVHLTTTSPDTAVRVTRIVTSPGSDLTTREYVLPIWVHPGTGTDYQICVDTPTTGWTRLTAPNGWSSRPFGPFGYEGSAQVVFMAPGTPGC